ncbi:thiol:disulfide interchange protein DsbA/DsbL [Kangiella sp. HD9-110m-PIT-SAG07]|nr:thiol:disulfide interchange protein DsbA/DsbL [Kangiella sp. HD9-110m-PIT-SAG07]
MNFQKVAVTLLTAAVLTLNGCSSEKEEKKPEQDVKQQPETKVEAKSEQQDTNQAPMMTTLVKEGVDYSVYTDKEASEKPVVFEFFSYTCPHCYNLEPVMQDWKRNYKPEEVTFKQIPVFIPQVAHLTYGFYTAKELDVLEQVHLSIFTEWHEKGNVIRTKDQLIPIFENAGISKAKFEETYGSSEVEKQVEKAKSLLTEFQVTSFPLLVVNEKYKVMSYQNLEELLGRFAINNTK